MSETPRYWRSQEAYRGNGEGGLLGSICSACGAKHFPSREGGVCPECGWRLSEKVEFNLGVGTLLFAEKNGVLNLVLFEEICDAIEDKDSQKLERIFSANNFDLLSQPSGLNTVTGKVDEVELNSSNLNEIDGALLQKATSAISREVNEEAGINLPEEKFSLLTSSDIVIDQFRGKYNEKGQPIINRFLILAFATLLSGEELDKLEKSTDRVVKLFDVSNLSELETKEIRKATRAILDFVNAALLWIAQLEDKKLEEPMLLEIIEKE